jgi:hypothetical protein
MSNQSFNQFAGQQAPAPVNPGFAQPGTPQGAPPPGFGAPPPGFGGAPHPTSVPPGAPAWPNQAPQQAPAGPPVQQYAPAVVPQAVPQGFAPPAQQYAPPAQQAPQAAPQAFGAPSAFGAGAFGAAKIMGDKLPCAPGLYRMRVSETGQRRDPKQGLPYWRLKCTVVQVFSGSQPPGTDVTTTQGLTGDQQIQYAGSFFLQLGAACFGVNNEAELKAVLNQRYGTFQAPNGMILDGWAQFADALQSESTQVNNCPANPLAGAEFIVEVQPGKPSKKDGKVYEEWRGLRRVQA